MIPGEMIGAALNYMIGRLNNIFLNCRHDLIITTFQSIENYLYAGDLATFLIRRYFCFSDDICNCLGLFFYRPDQTRKSLSYLRYCSRF